MYSDKEILEGIKTGDDFVMSYLYLKYRHKVIDFVVEHFGNEADADDTLQDSIVELFRKCNKHDFVINKNFDAYFTTVYRNRWRAVLKIKNKRTFTDEFPEDLVLEEIDLYNEYIHHRYQSVIAKKIKELGSDCQKVLEQYYSLNKSMDEIAYIMNYSNAQIAKNKKYRCVEYLKELLKNHIKL